MALEAGTKLGPYQILSPLGAGGMGEVYRAKDIRLDRTVAIKVLPSHLSDNTRLKERFEREARAVSSLNHPHICTLYDIGSENGIDFLVMEHIDGETLADRLKKGALPLDQALRYAVEVADALDKAHRQGVVHRDLKPGNIMLTKSGAKLLDFGLAKTAEEQASPGDLSALPTQAKPLTQEDSILGTFQYMAPEQLEGKEADSRTDIFAFGAVLYEMITGRRAFEGKSQASLITSIMGSEPPATSTMQPMSPASLDHVVQRCLAKVPDDRWQSASDVMHELRWSAEGSPEKGVLTRVSRRDRMRVVAGFLVGAVLAGVAVWSLKDSDNVIQRATRMTIPVPEGYEMYLGQDPQLALSPDGRTLAYYAGERLRVRSLDSFDAVPIAGTDKATTPFFSRDGTWIGFADLRPLLLMKVAAVGGPVLPIRDRAGSGLGADWGAGGEIAYVPALGSSGVWLTSEDGTTSRQITTVVDSSLENSHLWPQLLPDGKSLLFTVIGPSGGWEDSRIVVQDIASGERHETIEKGTYGRFVPTGHIVYAQANGTILAVPFDLSRLQVMGPPFTVASGVRVGMWGGAASFAVSDGGTFAFVRGTSGVQSLLNWMDREGKVIRQLGPALNGGWPSVSPDGRRIALTVRQPNHNDIWLVDTSSGERERFTFESTEDESPVWSPDGERIAYSSAWTGQARRVYVKAVDGSSEPELLYTGEYHLHLSSWSPDGKWLAFYQFHPETGTDIWLVSTNGEEELVPVATTTASERGAVFSPDGRWLAYGSDETGRTEVYTVSFPELGAKRQVSRNGGSFFPQWGAQVNELYYRNLNGDFMVAPMRGDGASLRSETPEFLFPDPDSDPAFGVAPDGRHFAILAANPDAPAREIHVVMNWFTELRAGGATN